MIELRIDDKVTKNVDDINYSLQSDSTNIELSYHKDTGFNVSVLDRATNIMRFYEVVDGKLKLSDIENIITGEEIMIRDDIFEKIKIGLQSEFDWIEEPLVEDTTFKKLELDAVQITDFSIFMMDNFNIPEPDFRTIMEWSSVKDIVDFIEANHQ